MLKLQAFTRALPLVCFSLFAACSSSNKSDPSSATATSDPPPVTPDQPAAAPADGSSGASSGTAGTAGSAGTGGNGSSAPTATPTPKPPTHHRCGWMNDDFTLGAATLAANADYFDAIHPVWYHLNADGSVSANQYADAADVLSTVRAHGMKLIPLVYGGNDATLIRNVFASSAAMTAHVNALVALAVAHQYDGLEIDYEHLWSASDRPGYTAFVTQLATALHAQGKELSLSVPAIEIDNGLNGYDFAALVAGGADVIHLMGYDYHWLGGDHLGPLAPIGWIDAVAARVQSLGLAEHFILGIANYGVGSGWYANAATAIGLCNGAYPTTTTHMATCSYGVRAPGISPHCTTAKGDVWFEDAASAGEKAMVAKTHGLRGIAHYTLGGEAPGMFDAFRAAYP